MRIQTQRSDDGVILRDGEVQRRRYRQFHDGLSCGARNNAATVNFVMGGLVGRWKDAATADFVMGLLVMQCKDAAIANFVVGSFWG